MDDSSFSVSDFVCHQALSWLLRSLRQFSHTADCVAADLAARARFGPIRGHSE